MEKYSKIIIGAAVIFTLFMACSVMTSPNNEQIAMANKPKHHTITGFQNYPPVESAVSMGAFFYLRRFWGSVVFPDIPDEHALPESEAVQLLNSVEGDRVTWLGHASFLIKTSGKTILTDPFLTERASPLSWAGPRRFVAPGISLDNLPPIDIIVVSHNHYDHLDDETIRSLKNRGEIHVVVPLGLKPFFTERGYHKVTELDWSEQASIGDITLIALPSVHHSARNTDDRNQTLWASWAIVTPINKILFIGDTGYSETIFKQIGEQYGQFDYALLPIGAYAPRKLMRMSHITPDEAVAVGTEVRANTLIASHWGTINLSDEPPWEPPKRFSEAGLDGGYTEKTLWIMKIGETRSLSQRNLSQ